MQDTPNTGLRGDAAGLLDTAAQEMFDQDLRWNPLYASQRGYSQFIADVPDLTTEARDIRRMELERLASSVRQIDPSALDGERRITREILLRKVDDALLGLTVGAYDFTVTPIPQTGIGASVIIGFPKAALRDARDADRYVQRCLRVAGLLKQASVQLREGRAAHRAPVRRLVERSIEQLDAYLNAPLAGDPLLAIADPAEGADPGWRDGLARVVRDDVRPAIAEYRNELADVVAPGARPDAEVGLAHLPDGVELYSRLAAEHTTTDVPVEEIHRTGVELVTALTDEMRELGEKTLGTADFTEIIGRLRNDPDLYFRTPDEVADAARDGLRRAQEALPQWLGRLPRAACVVTPMTPYEVENGDLGHYQWPTRDGSRPGTYWINTYRPNTRPRFESQTLAFHESVPGHHTQLALAGELSDLPEFRRHVHVTAFSEGWALYCERLGDQMGLYTDDIYRLGMISFDFWRACRLVVDTGMHAMGWSRDRAVGYMAEHSALTTKNIENEVDRYIGWPGQALGYMMGRLEIARIRAEAERRLGDRLVLRDFHSELIGHGSLPLSVLQSVMAGWIDRQVTA